MTSDHERAILFCPHCSNRSVQTQLLAHEYTQKLFETPSGKEIEAPSTYFIVKCETCTELLLYSRCHMFPDSYSDTALGDLVYPKQMILTKAVPYRVREAYLEASKVANISPTAYAILARRVVEEIARDKGVSDRNLAVGLKELEKRGDLPPVLVEATALVRLIGNAGAHASDTAVSPMDVWSIGDFLKVVIEYLYIAPDRVREFKARLKNPSHPPAPE